MNWRRIIVYAVIVFVATVMLVATFTFTTLRLGYEVADYRFIVVSQYLISSVVSFIVFCVLAMKQLDRPFTHAILVFLTNTVIAFVLCFILFRQFIFMEMLYIPYGLQIFVLIVATFLGIKLRKN